ncbi:LOW QUALITY PROTEIN: hypothetical protein U9M48_033148 [Paspalum notatum var. saurae]|uniref:Uncharacterized protein n=1 Tax=Paspalum notatum var. saurae TaxID=547442 RepID=A0AAQ3X6A4_PASNO
MDQMMGKNTAQQQITSTSRKIWFHASQSRPAGPVSPITADAMFSITCRGMMIISTFFSRSCTFQEGPAGADEHDDGEEQDALEEAEHKATSQPCAVPVRSTNHWSSAAHASLSALNSSSAPITAWMRSAVRRCLAQTNAHAARNAKCTTEAAAKMPGSGSRPTGRYSLSPERRRLYISVRTSMVTSTPSWQLLNSTVYWSSASTVSEPRPVPSGATSLNRNSRCTYLLVSGQKAPPVASA